jgi:hypothetical protein
MSSPLSQDKHYYAGVSDLLDGIQEAVSERVPRYAAVACEHGVKFDSECPDCELEAEIEGQHDSELAAEEDWSRWPR